VIEIIGHSGTPEYEAALKIRSALASYWPGIEESPAEQDHVNIAANTKLAGYKVSDIDVVIAAKFARGRFMVPKSTLKDKDGRRVAGAKIRVFSLVAAIEVKGHDASGLSINNGGVSVTYKEGSKSATDQNDAQAQALKSYFSDITRQNPWVYRSVLLNGINELPKDRGRQVPDAGAVAANFDFAGLLCSMVGVHGIGKIGNEYTISSGRPETIELILSASIFTQVLPSNLDRKKMDRIAARPPEALELADEIGVERVHTRGEGGTGKTILLAQAAHEAFRSHGKRSLFLTYNHALSADIQRLLALLGVPSSGESGGVDVRTVMSFIYSWLRRLGAIDANEDLDFDRYGEQCEKALEFYENGLLSDEDIASAKSANFEEFDYDAILVDEAQDWPQPEADLLIRLYGGQKISLADGISQLVRGKATNWRSSVRDREGTKNLPLHECLRMKSNLGQFANAVAERAGLNWRITPNSQAAGGRVIIRDGSFHEMAELHRDLLAKASSEGCEPIDCLYCVPASSVRTRGNRRVSLLGIAMEGRNLSVWDGVDEVSRRDYPRSTTDNRIVQYDSCRGLEGWVVVLDALDDFWEIKYRDAISKPFSSAAAMDPEEGARRTAWTWCMMALTRPIDTLVITVKDPDSVVSQVLKRIAETHPDIAKLE
jgi:hypothetical protein